MKRLLTLSLLAIFGGLLITSSPIRAQETEKKETKVRIKTVSEENGKKTVSDTTFVITDDMNADDLRKMGILMDGDDISVDVFLDSEGKHGKNKNVIILKEGEFYSSDDDHDVLFFHSDGKSKGNHRVVKWNSVDGEEMTLELEMEIENAMEELEKAHREMDIDIEILDGEHILVMKELKELKELGELGELAEIRALRDLDDLHELNDFRFKMIEAPHAPGHPDMHFFHKYDGKVSDVELRDAGIKNKQDRLDAKEIDIEVNDGVIDFYFTLEEEGSPRISVFNVYGDKVFSAKPEQMNGKYSQRIDLSKKQYGTYYVQVVMGNSSFTEKVRL
jgi:hypothetical protein